MSEEQEPDVQTQIEEEGEKEGTPFFPNHLLKEIIVVYIVLGVLLTLAIFLPFKLHDKADPLSTPEGIKPEWYFLWVYQALKYFPGNMIIATGKTVAVVLIFGVLVFLQFILPILDNSPERHPRKRKAVMTITAIALVFAILFMALGTLSDKTVSFAGNKYHFDLYGIPHKVAPEGQNIHPQGPNSADDGRGGP